MPFASPPGSTAELHNRLQGELHWGYTIYRATFSAQADAAFPTILRYIDACVKKSLFSECTSYSKNPPGAKYQSTVVEDAARFAGASIESALEAEGPGHVLKTTRFVKFPGWMKCSPRALWDLWKMMGDGEEMRNAWDDIHAIHGGVYCGP
ncbi:hypothetical protein BDW42DRAFT_199011 [Aspergillus taichungensis]|uniref:Uncharacterized protein n=1 Tax=Aspergillus taichungensis TaxID=482145 RepID=A0A2J5HGY0_9EURO|nr:hypothetical protein BDW42DRAFT_199011 [Aspergillus taichungensis]